MTLRLLPILVLFPALTVPHLYAQSQSASSGRTVQIPAGTPVTVHVMGRHTACQNFPGERNLKNDLVVQVDQDVVVDGVVVIPKGGFGLAVTDSVKTTFNRRTQARIVDSCVFHLLSVYTVGSVLTDFDPEPIELKRDRASAFSVTFTEGSSYTGKLQAASVAVPR